MDNMDHTDNFERGLDDLQKRIKYKFKDRGFLESALTHSSFSHLRKNKGMKDNERLEFLGDAVLKLLVTEALFEQYADMPEGELSKMRSQFVADKYLSELAVTYKLGQYIRFSYGEIRLNGHEKKSNLANALEALLGAIYLDGGYDAAKKVLIVFVSSLPLERVKKLNLVDYKTQVQEYLQGKKLPLPQYSIVGEKGPEHQKFFISKLSCVVNKETLSFEGEGPTKKESEQVAAREAWYYFSSLSK